jgi:hypothetical protein
VQAIQKGFDIEYLQEGTHLHRPIARAHPEDHMGTHSICLIKPRQRIAAKSVRCRLLVQVVTKSIRSAWEMCFSEWGKPSEPNRLWKTMMANGFLNCSTARLSRATCRSGH